MKNRLIQTFIAILCTLPFFNKIHAQAKIICGTHDLEELDKRQTENMEFLARNPLQQRAPIYIPIAIHLVGDNNGAGRVSEYKVIEQMNQLYKDYVKMGAIFYLRDSTFYYVNSTRIYNTPETSVSVDSMNRLKKGNCINVFVSKTATPPSASSIGTTLGYYSPTYDYLVVRIDQINKYSGTLSHELGHFFSLPHTFRGWDFEPWDQATHGTTVTALSPGGVPNERVNGGMGFNCTGTSEANRGGDRICDTPPDYNFGFGWTGCSEFTTVVNDPAGVRIDPQENNMMGYFIGCSSYIFTDDQSALKVADYNSSRRNYLRTYRRTPNTNTISTAPNLVFPINQELVDPYNDITLRWDPVPNAGFYVVEVSRSSSMDVDYKVYTTKNPFLRLRNLLANRPDYRWRVTPYNEAYFDVVSSPIQRFKTGIVNSVSQIEEISYMDIVPNPISQGESIEIWMNNIANFQGNISIINAAGVKVFERANQFFNKGDDKILIPSDNMAKGLYFLNINTTEGIITKKLILQ